MTKRVNGTDIDEPTDPRMGSATMTSGVATVYITDDGLVGGNGMLNPSGSYFVMTWINNKGNAYPCEGVLSNSNKTLTLGANQQGTTNANALLTLLGALGSFVTGINYSAVPNGTVVNYFILGTLA